MRAWYNSGEKESAMYSMKIVNLGSSPSKSGSSNTLTKAFMQGAAEAGHTVHILDIRRLP